jgi:hypothetical protein
MSICPPAWNRMTYRMDLHGISCLGFLLKFEKISVLVLKPDKNNTLSMETFIPLCPLAMTDLHN